jgi:replicative DNA helicase
VHTDLGVVVPSKNGGPPADAVPRVWRPFSEALMRYKRDLYSANKPPRTVKTGVPKLDKALGGGFGPGELVYIAGEGGVMKSSLLLSIALANARHGRPAMLVSLEMTETEVLNRLSSMVTGIPLQAFVEHDRGQTPMPSDRRKKHEEALDELASLPLWILPDRANGLEYEDIETVEHVAALHAERPEHAVVLVDYMQIFRSDGDRKSVEQNSRRLQRLAKHRQITVVVACQVNKPSGTGRERFGANWPEKPAGLWAPERKDLRETGMLGADADALLLLARSRQIDPYTVWVRIDKRRNGAETPYEPYGCAPAYVTMMNNADEGRSWPPARARA